MTPLSRNRKRDSNTAARRFDSHTSQALKPAIVNLCGHPATPDGESRDRLLVNFFYAPPVGHAVEALHYCLGHHLAHPEREISVVLNAASAVELAGFCPFVSEAFAVDHPLLEPCPDSAERQAAIPRRWDWVLDDHRRHQQLQLELFPGLRDYFPALVAAQGGDAGAIWSIDGVHLSYI